MAATHAGSRRRAHKLSSSSESSSDLRRYPRGEVQVTQAAAGRYIVLWRVIRVVDCRALVIDSLWLLAGSFWLDVQGRAVDLPFSRRRGQIYPGPLYCVLRFALAINCLDPDDQHSTIALSCRSACRISCSRARNTAFGTWPSPSVWRLPACLLTFLSVFRRLSSGLTSHRSVITTTSTRSSLASTDAFFARAARSVQKPAGHFARHGHQGQ